VDRWDLADPRPTPLEVLARGGSPCTALAASQERAAAGFADGRLVLFDWGTRQPLCPPWQANRGSLAVNSLALTPYPIRLLSDSQDGTVQSWDLRGTEVRPTQGQTLSYDIGATVSRLAVSPDATFAAVGTVGRGVRLYGMNPVGKQLTRPIDVGGRAGAADPATGTVTALAVSGQLPGRTAGRGQFFVLAAYSNQTAAVFRVVRQGVGEAADYEAESAHVGGAARYVAGGSPTPAGATALTDRRVTSAAFGDDADRLIVGTADGKALVWELAADGLTRPPVVLDAPPGRPASSLTAVKVTTGNQYAVTATADGTIRRWELSLFAPAAREARARELNVLSADALIDRVGQGAVFTVE
jgi:WD40 repeat protein